MSTSIWEDAIVPDAKLADYLLALDHPVGASKAAMLRRAGFEPSNAVSLAAALVDLARQGTIVARISTGHGVKLVVDGRLSTPVGRRLAWRTVWIVTIGTTAPRFVTAYPIRARGARS